MKRRAFLQVALGAPVASIANPLSIAPIQYPDFETHWLPPGLKDKSDPLGQRGFAVATCEIGGKKYGKAHTYTLPRFCEPEIDGERAVGAVIADLKEDLLRARIV